MVLSVSFLPAIAFDLVVHDVKFKLYYCILCNLICLLAVNWYLFVGMEHKMSGTLE